MRNIACILAVIFLLVGGCSSQDSSFIPGHDFSDVDKVAIISIEGAVRSEAAKDQIADFFMMELLKKGYAPIERTQVRTLLQEQEFESEGFDDSEKVVETGLILNVSAVFTVSIPHFNSNISMTAKMISVTDGRILWMGTGSGTGKRSIMSIFKFGKDDDVGIGSANEEFLAMTGALEGMPGKVLSPGDAKRTKNIVQKICRTLPPKPADIW